MTKEYIEQIFKNDFDWKVYGQYATVFLMKMRHYYKMGFDVSDMNKRILKNLLDKQTNEKN